MSYIRRLQMTSSPPCWMTINKRILISFIVPAIQHGRQGLCHLNLTGMVANHLFFVFMWRHYFPKLKIANPSAALVLSDLRPSNDLTFCNVSARQGFSIC